MQVDSSSKTRRQLPDQARVRAFRGDPLGPSSNVQAEDGAQTVFGNLGPRS